MWWKRAVLNSFLGVLTVWPAAHYVLTQTHYLHVWYGAGWAMYSVPKFTDDFRVVQRDGSLLPADVAMQESMGRALRMATTLRRLWNPEPSLRRIVASTPPGRIDGLYVYHRIQPFDGPRGVFEEPRVVWEFEVPASTPRTQASEYGAADGPLDGSWMSDEVGPVALRLTGSDGVWEISGDADLRVARSIAGCAGYRGCRTLRGGGEIALYQEGDTTWVAGCEGPDAAREMRRLRDDELRERDGRTVIWRAQEGVCWVDVGAVAFRRGP
jgi:hypothetical protein